MDLFPGAGTPGGIRPYQHGRKIGRGPRHGGGIPVREEPVQPGYPVEAATRIGFQTGHLRGSPG